ncbi:hypothetical protein LguiA_009598 [Lonicera macranthoides]
MAAAATFLLRLVVVLLGFSHLLCLNAVPFSRTRSFVHGSHGVHEVSEINHLANTENNREGQSTVGRMNIELNDYPGSGANNRHTPRHCADC